MSELCQSMIASYEDYSKSIFNPQSVTICNDNFDLFTLLHFIDNFMKIQVNRSNKDIHFDVYLDNFENDGNIGISQNLENFYTKTKEEIICSDESKLKRVLINLLSNSLKFTQRGSITLTVKKESSNPIPFYHFSVQDTGIGISDPDLEKLFTPFFSNNKNELNKNGVGLGLINVKQITEKLGEGLKVTSKLNQGTTISFLVYDNKSETKELKELKVSKSILKFKDTKKLENSSIAEVSEKYESHDEHTVEISDHVYMIQNNLKTNKLSYDKLSLNNSYSTLNEKIKISFLNSNKNESSNFLQPFSTIPSLFHNRSSRKALSKIDSSKAFKPRCNSSNQTIKLLKSRTNIIPELFNLLSERRKSNQNIIKLYQYSNLKCVLEIEFEINNSSNLIYGSNNSKFKFRRYNNPKNLNFDVKNFNFFRKYPKSLRKYSDGLGSSPEKKINSSKYNQNVNSLSFDSSNSSKKKFKVLIIDDEKSIRSFCRNILKKVSESEKIKFIIEEAEDGCEGLSKIFRKISKDIEIYDLIITDDSMTNIDGSNLFKLISFINENEIMKCSRKLYEKFIICSSDVNNVRNKIFSCKNYSNFYKDKNLILTEKPLKANLIKDLYISNE